MPEMLILSIYIIIALGVFALIMAALRYGKRVFWISSVALALAGGILSGCLARYFDNLPGDGPAPGLTWFGQTVFSLVATVFFAAQLLLIAVFYLVRHLRHR